MERKLGQCVTGVSRFSYVSVFEPSETPSGDMKYSVCIMSPKEDKANLTLINKAIQEAIQKGLETNKFPKAKVKTLRLPIRDGDKESEDGSRGPEFAGFWFLNASSKNQPGVVDKSMQPIMDPDNFFSGVWGRAHISFFPYNTAGNVGIGVGLNNVMLEKADERLDGRLSAEQAFGDFSESVADDSGEPAGDLE